MVNRSHVLHFSSSVHCSLDSLLSLWFYSFLGYIPLPLVTLLVAEGEGRSHPPVPDQEVSVSREWHGRVLLQGDRFPEVLAQLRHHQLLHGAGDGRALEIQKLTGVGHVQDGPRPAAAEGPGRSCRGAGRLLPPPPPRCPGAQQSAAFRAKTHALPRLSSPAPLGRAPTRDSPGSSQDAPAGETPRSQLCVYVNRAPEQQVLPPLPAGPSAARRRRRRSSGKMVPLQQLLVFCHRGHYRGARPALSRGRPSRQPLPACSALLARQVCGGPEYLLKEMVVVVAFSLHPASD